MKNIDYTGITSQQHNAIAEVMDVFDFDKVEAHMQHVDWGWSAPTPEDEWHLEVPDLDTIKYAVRKLLVRAYQSMNYCKKEDPNISAPCYSSAGGFTVYVWPNDTCQLFFSVTDWWVDFD